MVCADVVRVNEYARISRMSRMKLILAGAATAALVSQVSPLRADVVNAGATGFTVRETVQVSAPPAKAFESAVAIGRWWGSDHTYSGSAANMTIDPRPGGCWCEKLTGGGVKHMEVVFADPGKTIRLTGGLGPLQEMGASGAMTWEFKAGNGGTTMTWTYTVSGYAPGGFQQIAPAVDSVLTDQLGRLKKLIDTGKPE